MKQTPGCHLVDDLLLPTILFAALGGMTWAVRGSSGYGATPGCLFAGVMWGAAWWFIARDPARVQSRRYASGWIILAVTIGTGLSGARGWMQWPSFFDGKLMTNAGAGDSVPISTSYGFLWLFIAGMPWAGIGACMLAWCGSLREMRVWDWGLRIACGAGGGLLAQYLFDHYPQHFLPLYESIEERYKDLSANPSLRRLINDSGAAIRHLGFYLGFLLFEVLRRDVKNVVLILTVGIVNGAGWALCQNWKWSASFWPGASFNFWRCWESSGGISIGIAYGIAYFLVNRPMSEREREVVANRREMAGPNFEWWLTFTGLAAYLSLYLRGQMGASRESPGWGNLYFIVAILFSLLYYHVYHQTSASDSESSPQWGGLRLGSLEWGIVFLSAIWIAGLYLHRWIRIDPSDLLGFGPAFVAASLGLGLIWYAWRRTRFASERETSTPAQGDPNIERLGVALGLLTGLGLSVRNGLKGWCNIYMQMRPENRFCGFLWDYFAPDGTTRESKLTEAYWSSLIWDYLGPTFLVLLIAIALWFLLRPIPRSFQGDLFPRAYGVMWLVLIVQNVLGQLVTGPLSQWNEVVFNIYYVLLFLITAVIVEYYHRAKSGFAGSACAGENKA